MNNSKKHETQKSKDQGKNLEKLLNQYIQDIYRNQFGFKPPQVLEDEISIIASVNPTDKGISVNITPSLRQQIRTAITEMAVRTGAFQPGRVYCYLCETAFCNHSQPKKSDSVFDGYQSNGIPKWSGFLQILLDLEIQTNTLLDNSNRLTAHYIRGRDLKHNLMHGFGKASKTYDILAQVIIAYFKVNFSIDGLTQSQDTALTAQAIESRYPDGSFRLTLNLITNLPESERLADHLSIGAYRKVYQSLQKVLTTLHDIERLINRSPDHLKSKLKNDQLRKIPGVMHHIVKTVRQLDRQGSRRTRHAENRKSDNRPVSAAIEDVKSAQIEHFIWDRFRKTLAILGPKQRVHIFTESATHITSLKLNSEQIEKRIKQKRWRPATPDEMKLFKDNLNHLLS